MGEDNLFPSEGPDYGGILSGAAGGAATGFTLGGPVGAGIGAGVGLLSGIFGQSDSEKRRKRAIERLARLKEARTRTLASTAKLIGEQGTGFMQVATGSAKARALREGRTDASGDIAVAQQGVSAQFSPILAGALNRVNENFDQQEGKVSEDYGNTPLSPSLGTSVLTLGSSLLKMKQNNDYIKTLRGSGVSYGDTADIGGMSTGVQKPDISTYDYTPMNEYSWKD